MSKHTCISLAPLIAARITVLLLMFVGKEQLIGVPGDPLGGAKSYHQTTLF